MDERLRETLSAMLDDEADELAVRRVLASELDDEVLSQWLRWQQLSNQLSSRGSSWGAVDLRAGIWDRLDDNAETTVRQDARLVGNAVAQARRVSHSRGTAALAAMLMVALAVGFGAGQQWTGAPEQAGFAVAGGSLGQPASPDVPQVALQNLDEAQRKQLSSYLLRHARHNSAVAGDGPVGFARVASVSASGR